MGENGRRLGQLVQDILLAAATPLLAYYLIRSILSRLDPEAGQKEEARAKAVAASSKLDRVLQSKSHADHDGVPYDGYEARPRKEELTLSPYEQTVAMDLVAPEDIPIGFDDIGGLNDIIEELKESVIYPLTMPHLYTSSSSLLAAPSGVLLYGPPGCGKTMLAKALAHESGACFLNLHISTLTEKWYGDSNKLVAAVFSLARKLQPTIVFIDEIDAVLGQRRSGEHEASGMVKAEFMTHWDGLASSNSQGEPQRICILGATNRPQDIDEAIMRRLPKKFPVPLPSASQRSRIFKLVLDNTRLAPLGKGPTEFDLPKLVRLSAGLSGSDIKEACRDAAMVPVREMIRMQKDRGVPVGRDVQIRGLRTADFFGRKGTLTAQSLGDARAAPVEDLDGSDATEEVSTDGEGEPFENTAEHPVNDRRESREHNSSRVHQSA